MCIQLLNRIVMDGNCHPRIDPIKVETEMEVAEACGRAPVPLYSGQHDTILQRSQVTSLTRHRDDDILFLSSLHALQTLYL